MLAYSAPRLRSLANRSECDRRTSPRTLTVFLLAKIYRPSDSGLFRVRNISDTGLSVVAHGQFNLGDVVLVELATERPVAATVIRCGDDSCALQFQEPIDCARFLKRIAQQKRKDRRRAARLPVCKRAISYSEAGIHTVRVTNVSLRGVCLAHRGSLEPGTAIKLVLESGTTRHGAVCWSRDGYAGVFLKEPFAPYDLESVIGL